MTISEGRITISKAPNPAEAGSSSDSRAPERVVLGSWDLPEDVFQDGIFAKLEDGELFISLPKVPKVNRFSLSLPIRAQLQNLLLSDLKLPMPTGGGACLRSSY